MTHSEYKGPSVLIRFLDFFELHRWRCLLTRELRHWKLVEDHYSLFVSENVANIVHAELDTLVGGVCLILRVLGKLLVCLCDLLSSVTKHFFGSNDIELHSLITDELGAF